MIFRLEISSAGETGCSKGWSVTHYDLLRSFPNPTVTRLHPTNLEEFSNMKLAVRLSKAGEAGLPLAVGICAAGSCQTGIWK